MNSNDLFHFRHQTKYTFCKKYRWLILSNQSNIRYHSDPRMDSHFHVLMNTYDYEDALFRIDPNLKDFRDLKEMYVQFNSRNGGNPLLARNELKELIQTYKSSQFEIFRDFASLLKNSKTLLLIHLLWSKKSATAKFMMHVYLMVPSNPLTAK